MGLRAVKLEAESTGLGCVHGVGCNCVCGGEVCKAGSLWEEYWLYSAAMLIQLPWWGWDASCLWGCRPSVWD